jgi:TRAP-type C4-dicarboxylate transport system substrate-binding protein
MLSRHITRPAVAALMAAGVLGFGATGASAEDWKCYTYQSAPASPVVKGLERIGEEINKITKGRVNVKCSVGGALPIDANSIAPAMSDGVLDFGSAANISGYVPLAAMGLLPGLFANNAEYDAKGWPVIKPIVDAEFDKRGIKVLGVYHYPPQVVWGAKGAPPLKSLYDLKGKTLRIGNPEQGELAKAIGAVPVTLPTPDVSPALQRGGVQYVITAAASGGRLWRDFFASGLMDPFFVATSYIVINKNRWDKLSADERAAVQKVVDDVSKNYMTKAQEDDDTVAAKEFAEKDKWTIVPASTTVQGEITKVMEPIWVKWAQEKGPDAVKMLAEIRKAVGR